MDDEDDDFDDVEGFEIREPHLTRRHTDYESLDDDDDSDYFSADDDEEDDEDEDLDDEDSEDLDEFDDAYYSGR